MEIRLIVRPDNLDAAVAALRRVFDLTHVGTPNAATTPGKVRIYVRGRVRTPDRVAAPTDAAAYTAALDLPVEYVQPGWLYRLDDMWGAVAKTSDQWHGCRGGDCIAFGFVGEIANVMDELLEADSPDGDLSAPGESWLHYHLGDTVQVRIPAAGAR